ncbi:cadherin domain-containing protein [Caulobacter sp. 73W]|uniref:Cadherin domain-containing protein n=1 Tax=Caulobacter sp. 73W TaxID=3161137 RepID=A0AB39KWW9_9CAUL
MALNNIQPSLVLAQYIQTQGAYPSRDEGELGYNGYTLGFVRTASFAFAGGEDAMLASGQTLPVSPNVALYSILGINFGGNGQTSFRLPDLAGRVSVDDGGAAGAVGTISGVDQLTVTRNVLPAYAGGQGQSLSNNQPQLTLKWLVRVGDDDGMAGELAQFAGSFNPQGFLPADGRALNKTDYPALYQKLGDTYGASATTFNLPDMTGRTAIGVNSAAGLELGETVGSDTITITQANMPEGRDGQGAPINNLSPSLAVNYYIAAYGMYPSRDSGLYAEDVTVGEIRAFAGDGPSAGWIPLDGRILSIGDYQALYSLVINTFGGDGVTNFAVPDLRGKAIIGVGQSLGATYNLGQTVGQSTITLQEGDLGLYRPVNNVPQSVALDADRKVEFTGANAISITDQDYFTRPTTVTLSVSAGVLTATDGPASSSLTKTLTLPQLNTWLQSVVYEPPSGQFTGATLTIRTSDGSATDVDTIAIAPPPNASPVIADGQTFSAAENQTLIGTLAATDAEGETITYALVTGAGAHAHNQLVVIDPATGALSFKAAPDFEAGPKTLLVNVIATDANGNVSAPKTVTISVTDVNEAPSITALGGGASASTSVAENSTTVATLTASDPDAGDTLSWSISGGADAAKFIIDAATGELRFKDAPDFEQPASAAGTNVYAVTISVSDGALVGQQAITVTVTDVNDNAPQITSPDQVTVSENIAPTTVVAQVSATDIDTVGGAISYSLGGADAGRFTIDAAGALRFRSSPDFEAAADADGDNDFELTIIASDGVNSSSRGLTVTVEDANDAPTNVALVNVASLSEDADTSARIKVADIVVADDALGTNGLSLAGTDAALFEIWGGALYLKAGAALDFEAKPSLNVRVVASDAAVVGSSPVQATLNLPIADANEAPRITSHQGGGAGSVNVTENATAVAGMTAVDPDAGASLIWSIDGGADAAKFSINPATGELVFVTAPDFEQPGSAAGTNSYAVKIKVSDGTFADIQDLTVSVTDVNDNAPVITSSNSSTVAEKIATGAIAHQVTATDLDTAGGPITFSIGGADAGRFTIDGAGAVRFRASPDFEAPSDADGDNTYVLTVTASDGQNTTASGLTITVEDANDAPSGVSLSNLATIAEDADISSRIKVADIVVADDALGANTLSVSGTDAAKFEIDGGVLYLKAGVELDFETQPHLDVRVMAQDLGLQGSAAVGHDLRLMIEDVNEAPKITSNGGAALGAASVGEGSTLVTTVRALDPDAASTIRYAIVGGADAALFAIDDTTGELRFRTAPDFEAPASGQTTNIYSVEVEAADGPSAAGGLASRQTLSVTVTDRNDVAPVITSSPQAAVIEGVSAQAVVYTATATDRDTTGETISFTLRGADAAYFSISPSGQVRFLETPSFAAPKDAGGDNAYDLIVTATDGVNSSDKAIVVRVQPQPEPDPEPQPPAPQPGSGPGFVQAVSGVVGVDLSGDKAQSSTLTLADGRVVPNPVYEAAQALSAIQAQLTAGLITPQEAIERIVELSAPTFGVASDAYRFFTGSPPTDEGLVWLIDSPDNPNDLTDPYYAAFSVENRYINFAVNLGKNGEGRAAFESAYGAMSFSDAIAKAYEAIIGVNEAQAAGVDVAAAQRYIASQEGYFSALGGGGLGAKAAMVGYILSLGSTFHVGRYYEAMEDQVGDQIGLAGVGGAPVEAWAA